MTDTEAKSLCDQIREEAYDLHQWLRNGYLEKVYENGLKNRIMKKGIQVEQQSPVRVHDRDGTLLGDFLADLFVQNELIIELKAAKTLAEEHTVQILGYLRAFTKDTASSSTSAPQNSKSENTFSNIHKNHKDHPPTQPKPLCPLCLLWLKSPQPKPL